MDVLTAFAPQSPNVNHEEYLSYKQEYKDREWKPDTQVLDDTQTRRCMSCGHTFTYMQCDLIFAVFPKCPKCGSWLTRKVRFI